MKDLPTPTEEERYRCVDSAVMPMGQGYGLIQSYTDGTTYSLPVGHLPVLVGCQTFETLWCHAERAYRRELEARARQLDANPSLLNRIRAKALRVAATNTGLPEKAISDVESLLRKYASQGLLISESGLRNRVRKAIGVEEASASAAPSLSRLCIPTRRRSALLRKTLVSYAKNAKSHGRRISITIVDDGRSEQETLPNRELLSHFKSKYGMQVYYADLVERSKFSSRLAQHAGVDPEVVAFAVMGDTRCNSSVGACRNAFLLDAVGELLVQTDDDTVCRITGRGTEGGGLRVASRDPHSYWFYDDVSAATADAEFEERDFFGMHERLLGRSLRSCLSMVEHESGTLDVSEASTTILDDLTLMDVQVASTYTGALGDSGGRHHGFRLFLDGVSHNRLVREETIYRRGLATRVFKRVVPVMTVSDHPFCMTLNQGLDHRVLLPPFMPVLRNGDGTFGAVFHACFRNLLSGFLPSCVLHLPPARSQLESGEFFMHVVKRRTNDLLKWLILSFKPNPGSADNSDNLQRMGEKLINIASLNQDTFNRYMRATVARMVSVDVNLAERRLDLERTAPDYWVRDVMRYVLTLRESVDAVDCFNPSDLEGNLSTRQSVFRDLVLSYGRLMTVWPTLRQAAASLKRRGCRVVEAL